jgi:hypothetical protein
MGRLFLSPVADESDEKSALDSLRSLISIFSANIQLFSANLLKLGISFVLLALLACDTDYSTASASPDISTTFATSSSHR